MRVLFTQKAQDVILTKSEQLQQKPNDLTLVIKTTVEQRLQEQLIIKD
jgi:hypothetical protein